jgi:hypothetical protein
MFLAGARFLLALALVVLGLFVVSEFKILALVLSWAVIGFCTWILYVKCYGKNEAVKRRIDEDFARFVNSRFFKSASALVDKLKGKMRGR